MYEDITFEKLQKQTLSRVSQSLDKREGSIIYDATAPVNVELQNMYIALDTVLDEVFADTASRGYLIRRAKERGITPKRATYAIVKGEFNEAIHLGERFSLGDNNYVIIEEIEEGSYKLQCETLGSKPNAYLGTLKPIEYIQGLTKAELTEILIPGEEEEETEAFRKRYYNSFASQAFGGNKADYQNKVNSIEGVGGCKVYRGAYGGGTVGVVIIGSDYKKPSEVLIKKVQQVIDPIEASGEGEGLAPIYHKVTIEGVQSVVIDVSTQITYEAGYTFEDIESYLKEAIDKYLFELSSGWVESKAINVRINQIENRLLEIKGIVDVGNTKICHEASNLILQANEVPIRGEIVGETVN